MMTISRNIWEVVFAAEKFINVTAPEGMEDCCIDEYYALRDSIHRLGDELAADD